MADVTIKPLKMFKLVFKKFYKNLILIRQRIWDLTVAEALTLDPLTQER